MKLKNKKTGEIATLTLSTNGENMIIMGNDMHAHITKLSELKGYEDYEEPKEHYEILAMGAVMECKDTEDEIFRNQGQREIGNYFETKEEAELAVRKLKAWKRLEDFGCGFMLDDHFTVKFVGPDARKITSAEEQKSLSDSYKLLFGGKE